MSLGNLWLYSHSNGDVYSPGTMNYAVSEIGIDPTRDFLIIYLVDKYGCSNSKLFSLSDSIFLQLSDILDT